MKKFTGIKIVLIICFIYTSQTLFSQENNSKQTEKKSAETVKKGTSARSSEVQIKATTSTGSNNSDNVQKRVDTQGKSFQLDENDAYQGRAEEFLTLFTVKQLPTDFPKYEKWMGVRHYNEAITDYCKKHLDILTPIVQQKMAQIH